MRTIVCIYCQLPFMGPTDNCPNCGSSIDVAHSLTTPLPAANEDKALSIEDLEEEFELVPEDTAMALFGPPAAAHTPPGRPIPVPEKRVARA